MRVLLRSLVVASASEANAVTPTAVPIATFSLTALVALLVSTGVETANSLTSLIAMVRSEERRVGKECVAGRTLDLLRPSAWGAIAAAVGPALVVASAVEMLA